MSKQHSAPIRGEQGDEQGEANSRKVWDDTDNKWRDIYDIIAERDDLRTQVKMLQRYRDWLVDTIKAAGVEPDKVYRPINHESRPLRSAKDGSNE